LCRLTGMSGSSNIVVALIAAASAIAGAAVGGFATYETDRSLQDQQVQREEARQATAARAIARLMMSEYEDDADQLRYMIGTGEYAPEIYRARTFVSHIGQEERKLLAGRLSEREWVDLSEAAREVEIVEADVEIHRGTSAVGEEERETFKRARVACDAAAAALGPLARGGLS
jgi:hypothetical protein